MHEKNSPWVQTVAVDPKTIGVVNVASLNKIIPGWGSNSDLITPWLATL
jgi:simple sugar transport system substrate-binding protein